MKITLVVIITIHHSIKCCQSPKNKKIKNNFPSKWHECLSLRLKLNEHTDTVSFSYALECQQKKKGEEENIGSISEGIFKRLVRVSTISAISWCVHCIAAKRMNMSSWSYENKANQKKIYWNWLIKLYWPFFIVLSILCVCCLNQCMANEFQFQCTNLTTSGTNYSKFFFSYRLFRFRSTVYLSVHAFSSRIS